MNILLLDGNENQAVACVRSLARQGHQVTVGSEFTWSKAGLSRYSHGSFQYPDPDHDALAFVQSIAETARREAAALVLPLTERALMPISRHREILQLAGATVVLPAHEVVQRTTDKAKVLALAAQLGIDVPRSLPCSPATSAGDIVEACGFPLVLKPRSSVEQAGTGVRATGAPVYVGTGPELERGLVALSRRCSAFVAQEFVRGEGMGYFALCDRGTPLLEFAHRRLRDVRPSGSGSSLRESIAMPARLRDDGRRLLGALGWHGPAMVEFKVHDGRSVLMEVNGRFWGSLALAVRAGCDFPARLADLAAARHPGPSASSYREGVRVRWLVGDAQHLAAVLKGPPAGFPGTYPGRARTLVDVLVRGWQYPTDNFEWRDPLPEVADVIHFTTRRLPQFLRRHRD